MVQVNGRVRAKIMVPQGLPDEMLKEKALADPKVKEFTSGKEIAKILAVRGRLVNIVVK